MPSVSQTHRSPNFRCVSSMQSRGLWSVGLSDDDPGDNYDFWCLIHCCLGQGGVRPGSWTTLGIGEKFDL